MSANFVAREAGYPGGGVADWGRCDQATQEAFRPLETFGERFGGMLDEVKELGFEAMDLWCAHLHFLWATPEHVKTAQRELGERKLRVTSYAGGFGTTPREFRACCRLAAELGIPILGGSTPLLATDRPALVATLREFGLVFALENHPEKSPAELLEKLGAGDEDVLRVAADTGWFGTQGYPADEALRQLLPRLGIVHLKDVLAAGGHETCAHGRGVVPVAACLEVLRSGGYKGPVSIEHEPFDRDPGGECRTMLREVGGVLGRRPSPAARRVRVGIVGCGNIAEAYGRQLSSYPEVVVHGVTDIDPARSRAFERQFGPRAYASLDGLLADPDVELVVNLSIHSAHYEVVRSCLEAGKHVYTEKPLALDSGQARELVALAEERGLRLGAAPSTWLGEAQQTAWRQIREFRLGTPRVAYAEVNWGRIEWWHPNPAPFYEVGPVFDVAVYPITLLTAWFGPVREIVAGGGILFPHRVTKEGKPFTVAGEDWVCAVLRLESGLRARITPSFYVGGPDAGRGLEIHGDLGSLYLDRWDVFDTRVRFGKFGMPARPLPLDVPSGGGIEFARGVRDMARAMLSDRPHRCSGAHAAHVVEVCEGILRAARTGEKVVVGSEFPAPEFPEAL